ncbi:MAG: hypothetical protein KH365_05660 [Clostridiales bacterium]|nr:hypothetical protein [Clostridiales bacterium]
MKTCASYFKYSLKKVLVEMLTLTVFALLLVHFSVSQSIVHWKADGVLDIRRSDLCLWVPSAILGVLAAVLPLLRLSAFKSRRNIDTLYSFPLSRRKMVAVQLGMGIGEMFCAFTLSYLYFIFLYKLKAGAFHLFWLLPNYFVALVGGLILYFFVAFFFWQGNTVADGIVFAIGFAGAPALFVLDLSILFNSSLMSEAVWYLPFWHLNNTTGLFYYKAMQDSPEVMEVMGEQLSNNAYFWELDSLANKFYMYIVWFFVACILAAMLFYFAGRSKAEKAGDISDSFLGYRTLVPFYGYSILLNSTERAWEFSPIIYLLMIVGYILYRRGFKLRMSDWICLGGGVVPIVIGSMFK